MSKHVVIVHQLPDLDDRSAARDFVKALRARDSVHLLVVDNRSVELPAALLTAVRMSTTPVAAWASGNVSGAGLAVYAASEFRLTAPDARFAWGEDPIHPGLAAVLTERVGPPVRDALLWGEELVSERAVTCGLAHARADDLESGVRRVQATVDRVGLAALTLRSRAVRAAEDSGDWAASLEFDEHLRAIRTSS